MTTEFARATILRRRFLPTGEISWLALARVSAAYFGVGIISS
jgi:hypothetical protein